MRHRTPDDVPDFDSPDERVVIREIVRVERNGKSEHVYNQLIVAAIVALIGSVWVLGNNVARLMEWKEATQEWKIDAQRRIESLVREHSDKQRPDHDAD